MDTIRISDSLSISPRILAAAPHRLLFFAGAGNVLLAMAWWAVWLVDARWQLFELPQPPVWAGWMHAVVMEYQVLPPFMFGFLLTVFPRWSGLPELKARHYVPVGVGLLGGQLATLAGLFGVAALVHIGIVLTIAGWSYGLFHLWRLLVQERRAGRGPTWHALSCAVAISLGLVGLILVALYLHTGTAWLMFAAIKLGSFGLLLPVYVTVAHRMFPFFAASVVAGYRPWRPLWALALFWPLALGHVALELVHGYTWLWLTDLPLLLLMATLLWRWWPRGRAPGLLRVLFIGFAWCPLALALYTVQSVVFAIDGVFILGRAPQHALFIGFFGSALVAMVTRVTQGHAGRLLEMPAVAWFAFAAIQLVALLRFAAEVLPDGMAWNAVAALGWLLAFTPWALRNGRIYLTRRADGKPG